MECNKKRNIWILNHYAGNMFFDQGGRHYSFAKYLKRFGDEPVIFCCNAVHNGEGLFFQDDSLWHEHIAEGIQVPFVFVKGRPYSGNGLGRVLNMVDFYRNVKVAAKEYAKKNGKPDIILASSVHPLTLVAGIQLARYFHVKCICEVRDLWPETFIAHGLLSKYNPLVVILRTLEKWIYQKADSLVFTMEGGYDYIKERGWGKDIPPSKVHFINNGVDLEIFDSNKTSYFIDDKDLQNDDIFKVIYTGSIRLTNNVGRLLDTAKCVKNPSIRFLIWGKGDELSSLKERAKEENISNVFFKGYIEKKYVPYIVSHANLNVVHYSFSPVLRFGISLNKMFDYMAAAKPILVDFPCKYNPALQVGSGIGIDNVAPENIARAIEIFVTMEDEKYENYCQNARRGAEEYDFKNLTQRLLEIMAK